MHSIYILNEIKKKKKKTKQILNQLKENALLITKYLPTYFLMYAHCTPISSR